MQNSGKPGPTWQARWRQRWQQRWRPHSLSWRRVTQAFGKLGRWVAPVGLGMLAGAALVVVAAVFLINTGLPPLGNTLWLSGPTAGTATPAAGRGDEGTPGPSTVAEAEIAPTSTGSRAADSVGGSQPATAGRVRGAPPPSERPTSDPAAHPPQPSGSWPWPVQGEVLRGYGWFRHPVYDDWRLHAGIDVRVAAGMAVRAVQDGQVERVYNDPLEALSIQVSTREGIHLVYGGLAQALVQVGDTVKAEQTVGRAGAATDPQGRRYVHFGVKMGENPVDPVPWLQPRS